MRIGIAVLGVILAIGLLTGAASAQQAGDCQPGEASADLDVNDVRARLYNNGGLFWKGSGNVYTVPKDGAAQAIFASGVWIGGLANGEELRFAGTTYGPWEFWPGPLDAAGNPPSDCGEYDRVYSVYREDVERFRQYGTTTPDIAEWPGDLGAPYVDVNEDGAYDPEEGDYPDITGDQTVWWVMNDVGGTKEWSETAPIGLEVQVTAFAFDTPDALGETTFYRYKLIHKGDDPIVDTYLGLSVDPDVGNATDDFVGSDTTLGLGFAYNGSDFDPGADGYGSRPAAVGYDFLQGPLVPSQGDHWTDPDGTVHHDSIRLQMSHFVYYVGDSSLRGNPDGRTDDPYQYLQGIWRDGTPMTFGGTGYGGTEPADYMYSGDPVTSEYWSEENVDGLGNRSTPGDRRFLMSTGPFTFQPGDVQQIVFAIVWARAEGRLGSVGQLRMADVQVQGSYDANFHKMEVLDPPVPVVDPMDKALAISWIDPDTSSNYLKGFDERSTSIRREELPAEDITYTFEGYRLYKYASASDQTGEVIATLDVENGVRSIIDDVVDSRSGLLERRIVARGTDSGIRNYVQIDSLINYQTYHFGLQAYAYNPHSWPKVIESEIRRFSGMPVDPQRRGISTPSTSGDVIPSTKVAGLGDSEGVFATVTSPRRLTGNRYEIRFFRTEDGLTYDIVDAETDEATFDGRSYIAERGTPPPIGENVVSIDGVSFSMISEAPALEWVEQVAEPNSPRDNVWHALDNTASYYVSAAGTGRKEEVTEHIDWAAPRDFEIRFTDEGGFGVYAFEDQTVAITPFELWDIGVSTPDDPSDDIRMIPFLRSIDGSPKSAWGWAVGTDPYLSYPASDAIYFADPQGSDGYAQFAQHASDAGVGNPYPVETDGSSDGYWADLHGRFVTPLGSIILGDFDTDGEMPPSGTVIRFTTTKPLSDGDIFAVDTEAYAPVVSEDSARAALENIGIVPNPYRGESQYEVNATVDEVRFTNLQERTIVRVFTLSGDLVREMELSTFDNAWDLMTDEGHPIASGIYLVHVDVPGIGEKVLKFGVVKKRLVH